MPVSGTGIKHLDGRLAVKIIDAYGKSIKKVPGEIKSGVTAFRQVHGFAGE